MNYKKGDIVLVPVPFTNQTGSKKRPALVISDENVNYTGDILVVQITSQLYFDDFTVEINNDDTTVLLPKKSYIRCHKIFIIEQSLILDKISSLKIEKYQFVVSKIIDIIK